MTNNTKYTPGPWKTPVDHGDWELQNDASCSFGSMAIGKGKKVVALAVTNGWSNNELAANAQLMAAAPELLEALKAASDWIDAQLGEPRLEIQAKLKAAIAKATGQAT